MLVYLILALSSFCTTPTGSHFFVEAGGSVLAQDRLFWVPEEATGQAHTAVKVETEIEPEPHGNAARAARQWQSVYGSLARFFALAPCTAEATAGGQTDDLALRGTDASLLVLYHVFRI